MYIMVNRAGCLSSRLALGLWLLLLALAVPGCGPKVEVVERVGFFSQISPSPVEGPGSRNIIVFVPHAVFRSLYSIRGPLDTPTSTSVRVAPGESVELFVDHAFMGRGNHRYKFIGWKGKYIELEVHLCKSPLKPDEVKRILVLPYYQGGILITWKSD